MYERFYQLRNRPFALSPDPDFLYPSRVHREALDYLRFGIEGHAGFVVVTGEIGSGKTTLLQVLLRSLDGQTTVIRIVNTLLTGAELLEAMLLDLGVKIIADEQAGDGARAGAAAHLESARTAGVSSPIIDEAQNLSLGGARRTAHALESRDREIKAHTDRARRAARPRDIARSAVARAAPATSHRALPSRPARRGGDGRIHQPSARSRRRSRAARVLARRDGSRARAQRRYAAHDQRHLRRGTARGLCRERAGHRRAADADGNLGAGNVYGPAAQGRPRRLRQQPHRARLPSNKAHPRSAKHPTLPLSTPCRWLGLQPPLRPPGRLRRSTCVCGSRRRHLTPRSATAGSDPAEAAAVDAAAFADGASGAARGARHCSRSAHDREAAGGGS